MDVVATRRMDVATRRILSKSSFVTTPAAASLFLKTTSMKILIPLEKGVGIKVKGVLRSSICPNDGDLTSISPTLAWLSERYKRDLPVLFHIRRPEPCREGTKGMFQISDELPLPISKQLSLLIKSFVAHMPFATDEAFLSKSVF
ncbi:hypothetical protein PanWU01x14_113840 [Parasponia andersonii]|uniref:Uncharacterized protein n=1 Tax=Parasponia andersonii TaxID=3476 RepID=A0A2P5CY29_PARAD|nr:hypothetical protein PanWU01x14_113840 [Parasponia andersonii]